MINKPRLTLLALAAGAAWPAAAQQGAAGQDDVDTSQRIVVTASKRLEPQRAVAGTVSVLDGADLERRGARDQEDVLKLTPGVQFNKGDVASNTITIRGIGTSTTNEGGGAQQGPTGSYVEDVPLVSPTGKGVVADPLAWDLERIEVLRGPQGVLFGSGSLGGALRYLYNKPRFGVVEGSVKAEYARAAQGDGALSLYGTVNVPVSDTFALRAVAYDRRDPGYIDNLGTGTADANDVKQRGGRVLATLRPSKGLTATLVASTQDTDQGDTFSVSPDPGRLAHDAPNNSVRSSRTDFSSLTVDWDLGAQTLTSITGHWRSRSAQLIDDTELFGSVGMVLPQVVREASGSTEATSQELRLASNPGRALSWVAGALWQQVRSGGSGVQTDPSGAFGLTTLVDLTSRSKAREMALFADAEWAFGAWSVGAGGRYYRTRVEASQSGTTFGAPSGFGPYTRNDNGFTPRLSLKYRLAADSQWYATASKGYRYGGINQDGTSFSSDSLWSYETGLRLSPAAGLQVDLSAYLLDWSDAQFTYFFLQNGLPSSGIGNVGKARSTGVEAALRYRISPSFGVSASLASIDAKTRVAVDVPAGGASVPAAAGSRLPGTPRLQAALQGYWRFAGPLGTQGRLDATYTHVGERVMFLGGNKPADAFDTIDLGLSFTGERWTLAAGLANITNEKGVMSITGAPAGIGAFAQYFLQRPRTATVSLRYDF